MNRLPLRATRLLQLYRNTPRTLLHHQQPSVTKASLSHQLWANHQQQYSSHIVKMAGRVHRVTMFKLPDAANQQKLIEAYRTVDKTNQKDGKPYILSLAVGPAEEDPRSQGYTIVCKTEFASMDDLKYYDDECVAHQALKATAKDLGVQGVLTVFFKPQLLGGASP